MQGYAKNNPSQRNAILTLGIVFFMLFISLALVYLTPSLVQGIAKPFVVEIGNDIEEDEINSYKDIINHSIGSDVSTIDYVTRGEALALIEDDIDEKIYQDLISDNQLNNIFILNLMPESTISKESISAKLIDAGLPDFDLFEPEETLFTNPVIINAFKLLGIMITIFSLIICYYMISGLFSSVEPYLTYLHLEGAKSKFVSREGQSLLDRVFWLGWICGIVLFFVTIFLICYGMSISVTDISVIKLLTIIFIPCVILFIFQKLVINNKVRSIIKAI